MVEQPEMKRGGYTWDDYLKWPEDQRCEVIDGEAYAMSPTPGTRHQIIVHGLDRQLGNFFHGRRCRVFPAPMALRLSDSDAVEPDLMVVCDEEQITRSHIDGPPDLVIEILSPSSVFHDRIRKLNLYLRGRVKEYWLVTPFPSSVEIFLLDGDAYRLHATFAKQDTLVSPSFPGLAIDLSDVFDFPVDPDEEAGVIREGRPAYADV